MTESNTHTHEIRKKRQIKTVEVKEKTRKYLEENMMTPAHLLDQAPEWRERVLDQGKTITSQNNKIIELEAQIYRLTRENISLMRFKNKILAEKYGIKEEE